MCFSEEVSWATFGVGVVGAALLSRRSPALGTFLGFVAVMQLHEALLWREAGRCTDANDLVTRAAAITNHLQPVVLYAACAWLMRPLHTGGAGVAAAVAACLYAVMAVRVTREFVAERRCTRVGPHGGLVWEWNNHSPALYVLYLASMALTMYSYFGNSDVLWISMSSFVLSYVLYRDTKMIGSMWCFFAALTPWYFLASA